MGLWHLQSSLWRPGITAWKHFLVTQGVRYRKPVNISLSTCLRVAVTLPHLTPVNKVLSVHHASQNVPVTAPHLCQPALVSASHLCVIFLSLPLIATSRMSSDANAVAAKGQLTLTLYSVLTNTQMAQTTPLLACSCHSAPQVMFPGPHFIGSEYKMKWLEMTLLHRWLYSYMRFTSDLT